MALYQIICFTFLNKKKVETGITESLGLAKIIEIEDKSEIVNLLELQYRITDKSLLDFDANGTFQKVPKSKLIQKLILCMLIQGYT